MKHAPITHDDITALVKLAIAWVGTVAATVTLQSTVMAATLIYTLINIYVLVRDKIIRNRKED